MKFEWESHARVLAETGGVKMEVKDYEEYREKLKKMANIEGISAEEKNQVELVLKSVEKKIEKMKEETEVLTEEGGMKKDTAIQPDEIISSGAKSESGNGSGGYQGENEELRDLDESFRRDLESIEELLKEGGIDYQRAKEILKKYGDKFFEIFGRIKDKDDRNFVKDRIKGITDQEREITDREKRIEEARKAAELEKRKAADEEYLERWAIEEYNVFRSNEANQLEYSRKLGATITPEFYKRIPNAKILKVYGVTRDIWQDILTFRNKLINSAVRKAGTGNNKLEETLINCKFGMTANTLQEMLDKMPGFKECLADTLRFFFEKSRHENYEQVDENSFFIGYTEEGEAVLGSLMAVGSGIDGEEKRMGAIEGIKNRMLKKLKERFEGKENFDEAYMKDAVNAVWNFLYVTNVFSSASSRTMRFPSGIMKNLNEYQLWGMIHPNNKVVNKIFGDKQEFGGSYGSYILENYMKGTPWAIEMMKEMKEKNDRHAGPFLERNGLSLLEFMSCYVPMKEMINGKEEVVYREMSFIEAIMGDGKESYPYVWKRPENTYLKKPNGEIEKKEHGFDLGVIDWGAKYYSDMFKMWRGVFRLIEPKGSELEDMDNKTFCDTAAELRNAAAQGQESGYCPFAKTLTNVDFLKIIIANKIGVATYHENLYLKDLINPDYAILVDNVLGYFRKLFFDYNKSKGFEDNREIREKLKKAFNAQTGINWQRNRDFRLDASKRR